MKRSILLYMVLGMSFSSYADDAASVMGTLDNSFMAPSQNYNFEIRNKSKDDISLSVIKLEKGQDIPLIVDVRIPGTKGSKKETDVKVVRADFNIDKDIAVIIRKTDNAPVSASDVDVFVIPRIDKTVFVKYENGKLSTQSGKGFFDKKSQSGLSLNNNISDSSIKKETNRATIHRWLEKVFAEIGGTHYEILGVPNFSSPEVVRQAYKKKALVEHPDKGGDPERFKRMVAANEVLSNAGKKAAYDAQLRSKGIK